MECSGPPARRPLGTREEEIQTGRRRSPIEEAEHWAEQEMLTEAFSHWDEAGRVRRGRAPRRYRWWNEIPLRDLDTERELALLEMGFVLDESSGTTRSQSKRQRAKKRKRDRGTRASASRRRKVASKTAT